MEQSRQNKIIDLSIVIVNTNEGPVIFQCLRSIYEQTKDISFEVIIVDNASIDGSREMIEKGFPETIIVKNDTNLGFAASNNRGIPLSSGRYILLLNPDTEVLDGALQKTLGFMSQNLNAGVVGCKLLNSDGTVQRTVRSFPSLWNIFCEATFLYLLLPNSKLFGRYYMKYFDYSRSSSVDWLLGAFLMIRRDVVDRIGILDEQFFMYTEEVDYCYRTKQAGFDILYYPDARVFHHWSGPKVTKPFLIYWSHRSQILFFCKHFSAVDKILTIALKYFGLFLRLIVYFTTGVLTFNKKLIDKSYACGYTIFKLSFLSI